MPFLYQTLSLYGHLDSSLRQPHLVVEPEALYPGHPLLHLPTWRLSTRPPSSPRDCCTSYRIRQIWDKLLKSRRGCLEKLRPRESLKPKDFPKANLRAKPEGLPSENPDTHPLWIFNCLSQPAIEPPITLS